MPIFVVFLPLIAFGVGILVGYTMKPEDVIKSAEDVYGPEPTRKKPEKELPKWDKPC
jgi:hypothetical protein